MPRPIKITADIPTRRPGLGFADYVDALADTIRGGEPAQFTVGLYGPWGSGKSSLLSALREDLASDQELLVVLFDAWRLEKRQNIILPLLYAIGHADAVTSFDGVKERVKDFLLSLIASMSVEIPSGLPSPVGLKIDASTLVAQRKTDLDRLDAVFAQPLEELRRIPLALKGRRIVVLIDDLDRCSPDQVVGLLEAINLILDIPGFVFVLALDYDVLTAAVERKYTHVSGHQFIEKMIQIPFRVPPLLTNSRTLMRDLIPSWTEFVETHDPAVVDAVTSVSQIALRTNPRQIKRLVNYVLVLERIIERRKLGIPGEALVATVGLQLAWPEIYRQVQESALYSDGGAAEIFETNSESSVQNYGQTFRSTFADHDVLRRTLQLAASIETGETIPAISVERERFERILSQLDWIREEPTTIKQGTWLNKAFPEIRVQTYPGTFSVERLDPINGGEEFRTAVSTYYEHAGHTVIHLREWSDDMANYVEWSRARDEELARRPRTRDGLTWHGRSKS